MLEIHVPQVKDVDLKNMTLSFYVVENSGVPLQDREYVSLSCFCNLQVSHHLIFPHTSELLQVGQEIDAATKYENNKFICPVLKDTDCVHVFYTGDRKSEIVEVRVRDIKTKALISWVFYIVLSALEIDW